MAACDSATRPIRDAPGNGMQGKAKIRLMPDGLRLRSGTIVPAAGRLLCITREPSKRHGQYCRRSNSSS
jgi:hypothetical protein